MFFNVVQKGENEFWQYLVTIILVIIAYVVGQIPLAVIGFNKGRELGMNQSEILEIFESTNFELLGMEQNTSLFLILIMFICTMIGLWIGVKFIHKRIFKSLITAEKKINWSKIFFAFFLWIGMTAIFELGSYFFNPTIYTFRFDAMQFGVLLLLAIFILPIQTSLEELLFRGYLMQGMGWWTGNRWIAMLVTAVLFGSIHFMNPEVAKFGLLYMAPYYIGVGLFLAIITVMDDSLELALGVHWATNFWGATIMTFEDSALKTPALFYTSEINISLMLIGTLLMMIIFTFIVSKKYQWLSWNKLNKPILFVNFENEEVNKNLIA